MERIQSVYHRITKSITLISSVALVVMMLVTVINVLTRAFFNYSVNGAYETARFMCLAIVVFAIPNAELESAMVTVTFLEEWSAPKISNLFKIMWDFIGAAFFGFVGYYYIIQALSKAEANSVSATLLLPLWVPMVALSFCFFLLAISMLIKGGCCIAMHKHLSNARVVVSDNDSPSGSAQH